MKSPIIQITKAIEAAWTEDTRQKLVSFWSERRFRFSDASAASLFATRGHVLWNMISYDMTRVRADLSIEPAQSASISLVLTVHKIFQQITKWNRAFWELEMATCESFLLYGDRRNAEWLQFMKAHRKAALVWTLTLGLGGQRIPQKTDGNTNA